VPFSEMQIRDPNATFRNNMDQDELDCERIKGMAERTRSNRARLLDERARVIGLDIEGLNAQMQLKNQNASKEHMEHVLDEERFSNTLQKHVKDSVDLKLKQSQQAQEYAKFLDSQISEKIELSQNQATPDFDSRYLIGHKHDDQTKARESIERCKANNQFLIDQILAKKHHTCESTISPLPPSGDIESRKKRLALQFAEYNKGLAQAKSQTATPQSDNELYTMNSKPHSRATDYKGMTKNELRKYLLDNRAIEAQKNFTKSTDQHDQTQYYLASMLKMNLENQKAIDEANARRQVRRQCDYENSSRPPRETSSPGCKESFHEKFGISLL